MSGEQGERRGATAWNWLGSRPGQVACFAMAVWVGSLVDVAPSPSERLAFGIGTTLAATAVAVLLLGWWSGSRAYVPLGALFITGVLAVQTLNQRSANQRSVQSDVSAVRSLISSPETYIPSELPEVRPPREGAQMARATRLMMGELVVYVRTTAAAHGIDPDVEPEGWLSPRYLADAGKHPEVPRYFRASERYLAELEIGLEPWFQDVYPKSLRRAGLSEERVRAAMPLAERGFRRGMADSRQAIELNRELARAALELHEYLVSVDARVVYDAADDLARFERDLERHRAILLHGRVRAVARQVLEAQGTSRTRMQAFADTLSMLGELGGR